MNAVFTRLQVARTAGSDTEVDRELTGLGDACQAWAVLGKEARLSTFKRAAVSRQGCCLHENPRIPRLVGGFRSFSNQKARNSSSCSCMLRKVSPSRERIQSNTVSTAVQPFCPRHTVAAALLRHLEAVFWQTETT